MKNEPCAKLTTRVTPKISVSPSATRNSSDALASPFRVWMRNEATLAVRLLKPDGRDR
jgi:hypothetical protein